MPGNGHNNQHRPFYGLYMALGGETLNKGPLNGLLPSDFLDTAYSTDFDNARFGNALFGERMFGYYGALGSTRVSPTQTGDYRIELRQNDGTLIEKINEYWGSSWVDEANGLGSLSFSVNSPDVTVASYANPNEIWLYRGLEPYPRRKFIIQESGETEDDGRTLEVICEGLLSQIGREQIENYNAAGTPSTIEDIIRDWLADHQELTPNVQVGEIATAIGSTAFAASIPTNKERSILTALREIHDSIGGYFYSTTNRRIVWKNEIGNNVGHVIRFGKNAARVTHRLDYRKIQNRLICRAQDFSGSDLEVTVSDATSIAAYGERSGVYNPGFDVEDSAALTSLGNNELDRRKNPAERWEVEAIDLSHTDRYDYSWEALMMEPGSTVRLITANFDVITKVIRITRDLENPVAVILEVGDTSGGVGTDVSFRRDPGIIDAIVEAIKYVQQQRKL